MLEHYVRAFLEDVPCSAKEIDGG